jgi:hypothetical protein
MTKIIAKEHAEFLGQLKEYIVVIKQHLQLLILLYHYIGTGILKRQEEYGWGADTKSQW